MLKIKKQIIYDSEKDLIVVNNTKVFTSTLESIYGIVC